MPRHSKEKRELVATILETVRLDRVQQEALAAVLGVTTRTLRNWKRSQREPGRPEGRPPHSRADRWACARVVRAILKDKGYRLSEDEMLEQLDALKKPQPRRLVRWALQGLKARHRRRLRVLARKLRLHLKPLAEDVLWSMDATHLGYQADGAKLEGQLIVDVMGGKARGASLGDSPKAEDAIMLLEDARKTHGRLPLVLAIDNGYVSEALENYAREHQMILLVNLPYTPQHNTWVERAMRSLKEGIRDRLYPPELCGERALGLADVVLVMRESLLDLNARREARRRAKEGAETTKDRDRASRPRYDRELRSRLARGLALRLKLIPTERISARRRRLLERYAIFETLLEAGLVSLTRGGEPWEWMAWEELT